MDRRKKYTQMVLKESLLALIKEKPIANITVKELCERADINRSTYYAHYASPYELLYAIEEEFMGELVQTLNQYNFSKEEEAIQMMVKLFEFMADKSDICLVLFSENNDMHFQNKGMQITQEYVFDNWILDKKLDKETYDYLNLFLVSGSMYVIKNWLETGKKKTPQEMAEFLFGFVNRGLSGLGC
ncbi:TetR/AcrR family transcriptional regulator [Metabacillus iocasae]|uniref:AcrR family transcriptional regulator n=1 Tax=Priestia iocasae TaxID=2291674 RepID=A0ABS2QYS2_9BACI|nr:TetR/AcrR family transcriptional regulator [Metabacillus iocasae]MBM7704343.1 AcrR family transcriptional regulator [Metabacillus iocasae]